MWGIKRSSATRLPLSYLPSLNSPIKTDTFPDPVFLLSPPLLLQMKHQQVARPTHSFLARGKGPSDIKRERGKTEKDAGCERSFLPSPSLFRLIGLFFLQPSIIINEEGPQSRSQRRKWDYLSICAETPECSVFSRFQARWSHGIDKENQRLSDEALNFVREGPMPERDQEVETNRKLLMRCLMNLSLDY